MLNLNSAVQQKARQQLEVLWLLQHRQRVFLATLAGVEPKGPVAANRVKECKLSETCKSPASEKAREKVHMLAEVTETMQCNARMSKDTTALSAKRSQCNAALIH